MNFTKSKSGLLTPHTPEPPKVLRVFSAVFDSTYRRIDAEAAVGELRKSASEFVAHLKLPDADVVIYRHQHELEFEELT